MNLPDEEDPARGMTVNELERLNQAMDYIEAHLDEPLDVKMLSRILAFPAGLFQRMFTVLAGLPLSEYIRRRRLSRAAVELQTTPARVIDVALRYGYESADAFTAAFRRLHGVAPSAVRSGPVPLKSCPKLRFSICIQGGTEMDYQIHEKPAFCLAGKSILTTQASNAISEFWTESHRDGTIGQICRLMQPSVTGPDLIGACYDGQDDGRFRYLIGAETGADAAATASAGLELIEVPASTWLVFESTGAMPDAIQALWRRIFAEFLPGSGYRHAGTADLEVYPEGDTGSPDYRCAVWIPVVRE